jgi:hypothetical protein
VAVQHCFAKVAEQPAAVLRHIGRTIGPLQRTLCMDCVTHISSLTRRKTNVAMMRSAKAP